MARDRRREGLDKLSSLITDHGIASVAFKNAQDELKYFAADYERQLKVYNKRKSELETVYAAMVKKGKELGLVKDEPSHIPAQRGKGD